MPIYKYKCNECGHEFEIRQSIKAEPLKRCPWCGDKIFKMIQNISFKIEGGGTKTKKYNDGLDT